MAFIKHGDGKIIGVHDEIALSDEQKKSVLSKKMSEQLITQSDELADSSQTKKSGS